LKQIPTHFKAKREKGVGTPFPCIPPLQPCTGRKQFELRPTS